MLGLNGTAVRNHVRVDQRESSLQMVKGAELKVILMRPVEAREGNMDMKKLDPLGWGCVDTRKRDHQKSMIRQLKELKTVEENGIGVTDLQATEAGEPCDHQKVRPPRFNIRSVRRRIDYEDLEENARLMSRLPDQTSFVPGAFSPKDAELE